MSSANLAAKTQFKLANERPLAIENYTLACRAFFKALSFESLNRISATRFADLIQFWQDPNFRRPRTSKI